MEIHISNLSCTTTEEQLTALFAPFGIAHSSRIKTITDVSKISMTTIGYVSMEIRAEGEAATAQLHNTSFMGSVINVKEAG